MKNVDYGFVLRQLLIPEDVQNPKDCCVRVDILMPINHNTTSSEFQEPLLYLYTSLVMIDYCNI